MATLTQNQINTAQLIINSVTPGEYELKTLYGNNWQNIENPTSFGKAFKKAVSDESLKNIRFKNRASDNHNWYVVW